MLLAPLSDSRDVSTIQDNRGVVESVGGSVADLNACFAHGSNRLLNGPWGDGQLTRQFADGVENSRATRIVDDLAEILSDIGQIYAFAGGLHLYAHHLTFCIEVENESIHHLLGISALSG